jgi:hypothetical protein
MHGIYLNGMYLAYYNYQPDLLPMFKIILEARI